MEDLHLLSEEEIEMFYNYKVFTCQNPECVKEYKLLHKTPGMSETYCSQACANEFDPKLKMHRCDNPRCKNKFTLEHIIQGTYKYRKYCSPKCLVEEADVKKDEEELERQWHAMPYYQKVKLGIENMDEPYKWKERLQLRMLLDF